ncbi:MAG: chemotaxis protein CheW [Methyloligellaceae bacterium]
MDDLLGEFLTETAESLDVVDVELVKFEQEPNNAEILGNIFRLVHTIKGTCGFLGLPRLEALAHAAETLMGKYRDGAAVTQEGVTLILETLDRIKELLAELEQTGAEPEGKDTDLISKLNVISEGGTLEGSDAPAEEAAPEPEPEPELAPEPEKEPRLGEVSLDELERAFLEAEGPDGIDLSPQAAANLAAEAAAAGKGKDASAEEPKAEEPKEAVEEEAKQPEAAPSADEKTAQPQKEAPVVAQTIRVNVETLENLMTMVSELVLTRNQLLEMVRRLDDSEFKVPLQRLSNVTAELQEGVMKTRMQPIGNAWQKLPRIVRDLSKELDKKIQLDMIGAETELDRQVLEQIKDPLTHMVRNSADHGLETTADRIKAGKNEIGKVVLRAYHEGGHIIIEIEDDGKGLNRDAIAKKAIQNGLATESEIEKMNDSQIHKFIFHAGFSTADKITNVSGRGVGMDVVRTNIEYIGGNVDLKSVPGKGTTFFIKIPLTLAIVSALIVEASQQRFAIPQLSVVELVRAHKEGEHRIEMINRTPVLRLRNKLLPVIYLSRLLNLEALGEDGEERNLAEENVFVVVTQVGTQTFGIVVDSVFHTEEIVVKPMSTMLREISMFSGNTILGDGSVIMIIDPNGIAQQIETEQTPAVVDAEGGADIIDIGSRATTTMLLFRADSKELKAVPLSLVTRLEEINVADIEKSNDRDLVQYRGTLMPLIYINDRATHREEGPQPILVFTDEDRSMGLVVDEIVDIVEDHLNIEISADKKGMVGSAIIKGKATEIIDVAHYLPKAFDDWLENKDDKAAHKEYNLLLIDDSPFFRNMLAPLLGAAGYKVTLAESALDAIRLKDNGLVFDVIVSDIEMPDMTGIEFAASLRGDSRWGAIPIIALSSNTSPEIIERSRKAGFIDYVAKFDREGLIESLKECKTMLGAAA